MRHLRHGLTAAALLAATHSFGLAAEAPGLRESVLASHAVQPLKRLEFGIGLSHDALAPPDFSRWYGVYLQGLDRVAERNTIYGLLRNTARFGPDRGGTPPALCCPRIEALTSLEQFASTITTPEVTPTFLFFGLLRKKQWGLDLDDGWKVQAGVRTMQYANAARSKVGFLAVEHQWESLRATYSYQLERSSGLSIAPSHVVQLDYLISPSDSIGLSVAHGRELASFGALGMLNTEMRSAAVRGQHLIKRDWTLTYQAGYNHHGNMPAQNGVRLGVRHSF